MQPMTRFAVWVAFGIAAAAWSTAPAQRADDYPAKPVRVIIPFAPGGPPDVIGRPLLQKLSEAFGQTFVFDNRPGATLPSSRR